jgi:NhaP-type Na+/H+ or K+/H+ antiporter
VVVCFLFVFVSFITNLFRSGPPKTLPKLSGAFQFMLWFSGLRGGVAFAIAVVNFADNEFPENENSLQILQTTLFVALFTIFIFGGAITKLSIYLGVLESQKDHVTETHGMIGGVPRSDEQPPSSPPRKKSTFQKIDRRLKPILTHHRHPDDDQL